MTSTLPWQSAAPLRVLDTTDFDRAAQRLGCEVAVIRALWEVEAAGDGYLADGSLKRRFEPHHFPRAHWDDLGFGAAYLTAAQRAGAARRGWVGTLQAWQISVLQSSQAMLADAYRIDPAAALRASSWGGPQILGSNAEAAGYASAEAMVRSMARSAREQLAAFVRLVEAWGLAPALRAHDWITIARRYNGAGQVAYYAAQLEAAYRRWSGGQRSPVVLRVGDSGPAVAEMQRALGIPDDGHFGAGTLAAVEDYQRRAGLPVDGVVGARTWASLRALHQIDGAPGLAVDPPAQPSQVERRTDLAAGLTAATASVSGVAGAIGQLRDALPDDVYRVALWAAIAAAGVWLVMRYLRRRRRVAS